MVSSYKVESADVETRLNDALQMKNAITCTIMAYSFFSTITAVIQRQGSKLLRLDANVFVPVLFHVQLHDEIYDMHSQFQDTPTA